MYIVTPVPKKEDNSAEPLILIAGTLALTNSPS
jgi:hypothetical protein